MEVTPYNPKQFRKPPYSITNYKIESKITIKLSKTQYLNQTGSRIEFKKPSKFSMEVNLRKGLKNSNGTIQFPNSLSFKKISFNLRKTKQYFSLRILTLLFTILFSVGCSFFTQRWSGYLKHKNPKLYFLKQFDSFGADLK